MLEHPSILDYQSVKISRCGQSAGKNRAHPLSCPQRLHVELR